MSHVYIAWERDAGHGEPHLISVHGTLAGAQEAADLYAEQTYGDRPHPNDTAWSDDDGPWERFRHPAHLFVGRTRVET